LREKRGIQKTKKIYVEKKVEVKWRVPTDKEGGEWEWEKSGKGEGEKLRD